MGAERKDRVQSVENQFCAGSKSQVSGSIRQDRNRMSLVPPPLIGERFCSVTIHGRANGMVSDTGVSFDGGAEAGKDRGLWTGRKCAGLNRDKREAVTDRAER